MNIIQQPVKICLLCKHKLTLHGSGAECGRDGTFIEKPNEMVCVDDQGFEVDAPVARGAYRTPNSTK
jgi:hypothetical protein